MSTTITRCLARMRGVFKDSLMTAWLAARNRNARESFVHGAEYQQNAVDIFKGEWISAFPPDVPVTAGNVPLYEDGRLTWMSETVPVLDRSVLELGPLEGSHTYWLQKNGAASVTAIESNRRAFLKCLVTKELLALDRARFLCADFVEYLTCVPERFDVCVASGVLYHMREPLRLLQLMAAHADSVFLWTHYYDAARLADDPAHAHRFGPAFEVTGQGFSATGYRRSYGAQQWNPRHLGGDAGYSVWLSRETILNALRHYGLDDIVTGCEQPDHPAGPAFAVVARRTRA